jgi:Protein of unknown function (DUF2510)
MASRPYQHHSEAELLDLRRSLQNSIRQVEREKDAYMKRAGPGWWNNEGYKEIEDKLSRIWNQDSSIQEELTARRSERVPAPKPRPAARLSQRPPAPSRPAGWYPDPFFEASKRWWDGSHWTRHTSPSL